MDTTSGILSTDIKVTNQNVTITIAADFLGVSRWTLLRMAKLGQVPYTPYGLNDRLKRFNLKELEEWRKKRTVQARV